MSNTNISAVSEVPTPDTWGSSNAGTTRMLIYRSGLELIRKRFRAKIAGGPILSLASFLKHSEPSTNTPTA